MTQRDDTARQQQNAQRKGGNRVHHQKRDSQPRGAHEGQSADDKARQQQESANAPSDSAAVPTSGS